MAVADLPSIFASAFSAASKPFELNAVRTSVLLSLGRSLIAANRLLTRVSASDAPVSSTLVVTFSGRRSYLDTRFAIAASRAEVHLSRLRYQRLASPLRLAVIAASPFSAFSIALTRVRVEVAIWSRMSFAS